MTIDPSGGPRDAGTGTQFVTVTRRAFLFNGDLERCVDEAIAGLLVALVLDVSLLAPVDDIVAARLDQVAQRLCGGGVDLVIVCPHGGLPADRAGRR